MRKLMWFTLGFGAVCGVCAYLWLMDSLLIPAIISAVCFGICMILGKRWKWIARIGLLFLGAAVGLTWFQLYSRHYLQAAGATDGYVADVTAQCTDYSYFTDYGTAVETVLYLNGKPYRAKLYVSGQIEMEPGDVVKGAFLLEVTTPDGSDAATAHQGKGIFLLGYQAEDAELMKLTKKPGWGFPAKLRKNITSLIDECFPADTAGFARALLLGDRTGIEYKINTAFKISGIAHIIAVSGLHVSILFALINILCFKRRFLVALFGIPLLCLFAAVAGLSPSVVRACIMQGLMIGAMLLERDYDGPTELAFSCLVMLVCNPLVITSISFQLSVGCVAGILLFNSHIQSYLLEKLHAEKRRKFFKVKRWLAGSVSVTLSAMIFTTPLVAVHFGAISLIGVLTNLLTLWAVAFIFYGIMLACLLGAFWPAVGTFVGTTISWLIRYVLVTAQLLSRFPLAAVYTRSVYIVAWLIFCYLLLVSFLLSVRKRPAVLACCCVIGLCVSIGASWLEPLTDDCRMTVLDVEQGQCILLQSEGKTYMVDCGGSYDEDAADLAAETLLSQGIFRVDGVILSHFDRDHSGGLPYFLTRIPADTIFVPEVNVPVEELLDLRENVFPVSDNLLVTYGSTKMTIFGPVVPNSGNESSLAVLFEGENCDILITGDRSEFGERILMKQVELPDLEVLVAGHHGSRNSTSAELLAATAPDILVFSVGDNPYGMPHPEVLERAEAAGAAVLRTDRDGNIILRR